MSLSWTQPTCEQCWIAQHHEVHDDRISVERPVMVKDSTLERCSYCGSPTFIGIYTRADPQTVLYPREKDD